MCDEFLSVLDGRLHFDIRQLAFCTHYSWFGVAKKERLGIEQVYAFYNRSPALLSPNLLTFHVDGPEGGSEWQKSRTNSALHVEESDGRGFAGRMAFTDSDILFYSAESGREQRRGRRPRQVPAAGVRSAARTERSVRGCFAPADDRNANSSHGRPRPRSESPAHDMPHRAEGILGCSRNRRRRRTGAIWHEDHDPRRAGAQLRPRGGKPSRASRPSCWESARGRPLIRSRSASAASMRRASRPRRHLPPTGFRRRSTSSASMASRSITACTTRRPPTNCSATPSRLAGRSAGTRRFPAAGPTAPIICGTRASSAAAWGCSMSAWPRTSCSRCARIRRPTARSRSSSARPGTAPARLSRR